MEFNFRDVNVDNKCLDIHKSSMGVLKKKLQMTNLVRRNLA